jgi:hypothetical protein
MYFNRLIKLYFIKIKVFFIQKIKIDGHQNFTINNLILNLNCYCNKKILPIGCIFNYQKINLIYLFLLLQKVILKSNV